MNGPDESRGRLSLWRKRLVRLGDSLTREYCPEYDHYLKWARNPLVVLILATFVSALCGLALHSQGFLLSIGLGATLTAGVIWPWLSLRGLRGTLSFEKARSREGETIRATLRLVNRSPWTIWGLSIHAGLGEEANAGLARAGGRAKTESTWDFVPDRRGVYPGELPRFATGFPFGLSIASRPLIVSGSLLVWPRTFPVGPIPTVSAGRSAVGLSARNRPGDSGDFLGVRAYRRGDSLRRVHWPQTARLGQMVVCELQTDAVPRVQVVLDAHPACHRGDGPKGSREWAIRIAASFLESWMGQGAEVELVVDGHAVLAGLGPIETRSARLLDALARVGPGGERSLSDSLVAPACRRFSSGLRLIVATDLAVSRITAPPGRGVCERFVVLHAAAFDLSGSVADPGPLPVRPWAWIDDPDRVPHQVRSAWKEVRVEA